MVPFPLLRVAGWCCVCHDSNITSGRQGDPWTTSCRSTIMLWRMGMWLPKQFDEHAFSCNHKVNLSNTSVIDAHTHTQTCCMLKSWHIQHQHATLNKEIGTMLPFSLFPFFLFPATNLLYEHMCLMWSHQHLSVMLYLYISACKCKLSSIGCWNVWTIPSECRASVLVNITHSPLL